MSDELGTTDPTKANPIAVRQAAHDAARALDDNSVGSLWDQDGPGLLALCWSADPSGGRFNAWSIELGERHSADD